MSEALRDDVDIMPIPADIDHGELETILLAAGLPLHLWGQGDAKTTGHLLAELRAGESAMSVDATGNIYRRVRLLWVHVFHIAANGNLYRLREEKQVLTDGYERVRTLPASLGEKMKPDETPDEAVARALSEEIQVSTVAQHHVVNEEESTFTPPSYPGLSSQYETHTHLIVIPEDAFNPDGYVERQEDKTNYYVWDLVA